jgi:hypothetical protein
MDASTNMQPPPLVASCPKRPPVVRSATPQTHRHAKDSQAFRLSRSYADSDRPRDSSAIRIQCFLGKCPHMLGWTSAVDE